MAEILGVVASGVSVVQIGGLLLGSIENLRTLRRTIRDAPKELQSTLDDIGMMGQLLSEIRTFEEDSFSPTMISALRTSLEHCEAAMSSLENLITKGKLTHRHRMQAIFKKEEIKEQKEKLDSARASLQLALSCYQTIMIQKQAKILQNFTSESSIPSAISINNESEFTIFKPKNKEPAMWRYSHNYQERLCSLNRCCCICHEYTTYRGRSWFLTMPSASWIRKACDQASCINSKKASLWISLTQVGIPFAFRVGLQFILSSQRSHIAPSLSFERIVRRTSPGFGLLEELERGYRRDWETSRQDLVRLFEEGKASPTDIDPDGNTWLEKLLRYPWPPGRRDIQFSLLSMLIEQGTQINTLGLLYKSIKWIGEGPHIFLLESLIRSGFDVSAIEAPSFQLWPRPFSEEWYALELAPDPFFVNWISMNLENCPGFAGMNALQEAILIDSRGEVKRLLTTFPINEQNNLLGQSALHLAVFRSQHIDILLEAGAGIDSRDKYGMTPLMYAAAMGNTLVLVRLLELGANPHLTDYPYGRCFLHYATRRGHWATLLHVLAHFANKPWISNLLNLGAILWVSDRNTLCKDLNDFRALLDMGADPNILYDSEYSVDGTLAHNMRDEGGMKILVSCGFTNFNHLDASGSHAIISASNCVSALDTGELELLLEGGSLINHQNHNGHTALHVISCHLQTELPLSEKTPEINEEYCDRRTKVLECIRHLLGKQANLFQGDNCRCACSRSGCTPFHMILQGSGSHYSQSFSRSGIWTLEYLDIIRKVLGSEAVRVCLLSMIRLVKFCDSELTHTCRDHEQFSYRRAMDNQEIEEILSEEREIVELMEDELHEFETVPLTDSDHTILTTLFQLSLKYKMKFRAHCESKGNRPKFSAQKKLQQPTSPHQTSSPRLMVDYWRDQFIADNFWLPTYGIVELDVLCVDGYVMWVDYEHSKHQKQNIPDADWYEKRIRWISSIREMNMAYRTERKETESAESQ